MPKTGWDDERVKPVASRNVLSSIPGVCTSTLWPGTGPTVCWQLLTQFTTNPPRCLLCWQNVSFKSISYYGCSWLTHSDCDAISCSLENAHVHKLHKSRSRLTDSSSEFPEQSHFVIIGLKNHPRVIISECIEYISSMGQLKKCSYGWAVFESKS